MLIHGHALHRMLLFACVSVILIMPLQSSADFTAKVKRVYDGDTIIVLHGGKEEHVRFNGIDAPEKDQAYGKKAKQYTEHATLGKEVTVIERGKDDRGRTIGDVILPDGTNLNQQLVKEGLAWWFWKYTQDETLKALAEEAQDKKLGLWQARHPIPPWVFRKMEKPPLPHVEDFEPPGKVPSHMQNAQTEGTTGLIIGHRKSHVYHRPGCPNYGKVSEKYAVEFQTVEEAEDAGHKIAKNCPR